MLANKYSLDWLKTTLVDPWQPYPKVEDRDGWASIPEQLGLEYVARGERALEFEWSTIPATLFLDCARTGNRSRYQAERNKHRNALGDLVLAECIEGQGRFLDQILNGIWATCEETYWGVPAHLSLQAAEKGLPNAAEPSVDLFSGETSALLAWTSYLAGEGSLKLQASPLPDGRVTGSASIAYGPSLEMSLKEISLEDGERLHKIWRPRVVRISLSGSTTSKDGSWMLRLNR